MSQCGMCRNVWHVFQHATYPRRSSGNPLVPTDVSYDPSESTAAWSYQYYDTYNNLHKYIHIQKRDIELIGS